MSDHGQYSTHEVILKKYVTYRHLSGSGLTRGGVSVLAALRRAKVKSVSHDELAKRSGLSRATVIKSIKDLEALGYVRVTRTPGSDNQYEVLRGIK